MREVDEPRQLGREEDEEDDGRRDRPGADAAPAESNVCPVWGRESWIRPGRRPRAPPPSLDYTPQRRVRHDGPREPREPREAVRVDRASGDHAERQGRPRAAHRRQEQREAEHEERLDRLLEGLLRQIGRGEVAERDERGADRARRRPELGERAGRDDRDQHRDRERQPRERLDRAAAEDRADAIDERVRPDRVAIADELRHRALMRAQPVGDPPPYPPRTCGRPTGLADRDPGLHRQRAVAALAARC